MLKLVVSHLKGDLFLSPQMVIFIGTSSCYKFASVDVAFQYVSEQLHIPNLFSFIPSVVLWSDALFN